MPLKSRASDRSLRAAAPMAASAPEALETSASGASLKQLIPESAAIDIAPKQAAATVLGHSAEAISPGRWLEQIR
jgi:hypothetical protein